MNDGTTGRGYWTTGLMAEKIWERLIYTCSITDPVFKDIYAPLDGFLVNGGIKFKL